uniref:Ovule protein n=1 Tax=Echinococcus granulosus TaxID=6210 RepID=A0A068WM47_ECHGR|nr:hypothetical protein EgrG_000157700 [Echinococcus granulosus]
MSDTLAHRFPIFDSPFALNRSRAPAPHDNDDDGGVMMMIPLLPMMMLMTVPPTLFPVHVNVGGENFCVPADFTSQSSLIERGNPSSPTSIPSFLLSLLRSYLPPCVHKPAFNTELQLTWCLPSPPTQLLSLLPLLILVLTPNPSCQGDMNNNLWQLKQMPV